MNVALLQLGILGVLAAAWRARAPGTTLYARAPAATPGDGGCWLSVGAMPAR